MRTACTILAAAAGLSCCNCRADFTFADFSSTTGLTLVGNPTVNGTNLRMTAALEGQLGAAWYVDKQSIAGGFTTEFRFRITEPGGVPDFFNGLGADGLAFVIQNADGGIIGNPGSGMGYETIPNSLAVEFDTWGHPFFGDPNGNHVSVQSLGTAPNSYTPNASLGLNQNIPELTSGNTFLARIVYAPGTITVFLDGVQVLNVAVDLSTLLNLDQGRAWVGFTASTGGAWENHDLASWTFTSGAACYPNCDGSTQPPLLNVNDFVCFTQRFAAADPYANCDASTQPPVLNVNDFVCFTQRFAAGCP
jgi:hypothetical protein